MDDYTTAGLETIKSRIDLKGSVIGCLGPLPFVCSRNRVLTFTELSRENSARWAKHDVIGAKPVLEYIGEDLSTITITIRFDISLGVAPRLGLKALKQMLRKRQYNALIIGGEHLGRFVLKKVDEVRMYHTGAGVCQVATATIELEEYGR